MRGTSTILVSLCFFFFNDTATTEIYTLSLHDALPIPRLRGTLRSHVPELAAAPPRPGGPRGPREADDRTPTDGRGRPGGRQCRHPGGIHLRRPIRGPRPDLRSAVPAPTGQRSGRPGRLPDTAVRPRFHLRTRPGRSAVPVRGRRRPPPDRAQQGGRRGPAPEREGARPPRGRPQRREPDHLRARPRGPEEPQPGRRYPGARGPPARAALRRGPRRRALALSMGRHPRLPRPARRDRGD